MPYPRRPNPRHRDPLEPHKLADPNANLPHDANARLIDDLAEDHYRRYFGAKPDIVHLFKHGSEWSVPGWVVNPKMRDYIVKYRAPQYRENLAVFLIVDLAARTAQFAGWGTFTEVLFKLKPWGKVEADGKKKGSIIWRERDEKFPVTMRTFPVPLLRGRTLDGAIAPPPAPKPPVVVQQKLF